MKITLNGEPYEHRGDGTVRTLLDEVGATPEQTALMWNGDVIPRERWPSVILRESDQVELLVFACGG